MKNTEVVELMLEEQQNYFMREAFNTLRTNILFSGKDVKNIVITSCMAHEGKTTISTELAKSLAESGKKVLLIDADLRKSVMVNRYTKNRGLMGLSQILSGQVHMDDAIYKTQMEGLDIVFAGPYPPNPSELIGSSAFKELLDAKRDSYDYILIDAAPLGLVIDAAVMASVCDGAVLVINSGTIKYRFAQEVKAQLQKSGCKILGVVLNKVGRKGGKGYGGYYYNSYGSYYGGKGYYGNEGAAGSKTQQAKKSAGLIKRPMPTKKNDQ